MTIWIQQRIKSKTIKKVKQAKVKQKSKLQMMIPKWIKFRNLEWIQTTWGCLKSKTNHMHTTIKQLVIQIDITAYMNSVFTLIIRNMIKVMVFCKKMKTIRRMVRMLHNIKMINKK